MLRFECLINLLPFSGVKTSTILEQYERQQPWAQTLLQRMPWSIPLVDRVVLFRYVLRNLFGTLIAIINNFCRKLVQRDKKATSGGCTVITVDRRRIIEDSYRQLASLSSHALRSTVRVKFINMQGLDEAGIDQDGVFKEFLEITLQKVCQTLKKSFYLRMAIYRFLILN